MVRLTIQRLAASVVIGVMVAPAFGESFLLAPENAIPLHSTTQPALTDSPLDLWLAGKKDAALAAFLATDWTTGGFLTADPILGLTEAEFDQRMANDPKLQQELTDRTNALKSLSKEVLTRGDADVKNAKPDDARSCFVNVQSFGTYLSSHDGELAILKLVGTAYKKAATDRLAKIPPAGQ